MKESNKEKIETALQNNPSLDDLQSSLKEIITDEIFTYPQLSDSMKSLGLEWVKHIDIPVKTATLLQKESRNKSIDFSSTVAKVGIGAGIATLSMSLAGKNNRVFGAVGGVTGALLAGLALNKLEKKETSLQTREQVVSTTQGIEEAVDRLLSMLAELDDHFESSETEERPVSMTFGDNYSNIIKWLQNIYLETDSYGEECSGSLRRKIERILGTVYCDTVHYDGKNDGLFEFNNDSTITEPLELYPAIVANSGKIYPGLVSKPYKNE